MPTDRTPEYHRTNASIIPSATPHEVISQRPKAIADESQAQLNRLIAERLYEYAQLLEEQGDDHFRPRAYRRAAATIEALPEPLDSIFVQKGHEGLVSLPAVGSGIAAAIEEILSSGRWQQLDRLRGELSPAALFQTLPGVGPELARRLSEDAQLETLEELEEAIHLHKLKLRGLGPRKLKMLSASLAQRLGSAQGRYRIDGEFPPLELILKIDRMYRERAAQGKLTLIAPRRFNADGEAWLPVMHANHDGWHFTALYSNSRLAHQLGKTRNWVVVYAHLDGKPETRCTVVTEMRGPRKGQRVVRGYPEDVKTQL